MRCMRPTRAAPNSRLFAAMRPVTVPRRAPIAPPSRCARACRLVLAAALTPPGTARTTPTVVYKFGGSSVASADRMREVADIVCSFGDELPVVVLSAMGKVSLFLLSLIGDVKRGGGN